MIRVLLIVLICVQVAWAQVIIKGVVTCDGKPVGFANVGVEGTSIGAVANEKGIFQFNYTQPGSVKLVCSAVGYQTETIKVQLNNGENKVTFRIDESVNSLNDVVVSGTMKEISRMKSPVPVEIYTPKFFLKNPTNNMFDALQMVNGVQPTINCNVCNTGDIHINGMEGPYTMVMIDGMPIVSSLSTVYGLMGIPNSMIERIEIVKGPASTLYGSEAVAGLINVITKQPSKAPLVSFDMFATTYNEYNVDASVKYRLGKVDGLLSTNVFLLDKPWDKNGDNFTDVTLQNRQSVFSKWSFNRKHNRIASVGMRYLHENRWGGEMQWNESFRGTDSVYGESIYTDRFELIGTYQLPIQESVKLMYSGTYHYQNSYYGVKSFNGDQRIGFAQLVWDKKLGNRHDLLLGTAMRYTFYDDNTTATAKGDSLQPQNNPSKTWLPGVFVQDEIALSASQTLLVGLRYDYFQQHGSILSPRVNYKWMPNPYQTFRFSVGNGFRVVNLFTEDHAALTGAREVVVKEALKPEQSWNANINYNRFINLSKGFCVIDASVFYTYFSNRITADYDTDPNLIIYDNLDGYAVSRGMSFNIEYSFTFPLKLNAGFTAMQVFQQDKDSMGVSQRKTQVHAPPFSGTFQVSYTFKRIGLSIDWTGQVYSPMRLPVLPNDYRSDYSPWYTLQNIQLTQRVGKSLQFYGGIKNIFDFMPTDPIMRAFDPFDKHVTENNPNGYTFDPSYNYAPLQGRRLFVGVRYVLGG